MTENATALAAGGSRGSDGRDLTSLLSNRTLAALERMALAVGRERTNRGHGEHLARRGGSSTEFRDYRDYVAGDDVRFVDWNVFARLHRPYVKQFHEEEEQSVALLVDASASMKAGDKLRRATELAAALGAIALASGERLTVHGFGGPGGAAGGGRTPVLRRRRSFRDLFAFLESLDGAGCAGAVPLEVGIESLLREHVGRGALIVLSDFLTGGDLTRVANHAFGRGLAVFGLQVLAPEELEPDLAGDDFRLVDCESGETVDVTGLQDLLASYHDERERLARQLELLCRQRAGRFAVVDSGDDVESILFKQLRPRGWFR